MEGGPLAGPIFETMVITELKKRSEHRGLERDFWFYRDNAGNEIDLIIHDHAESTVSFIEIKWGQTAKSEWAYHLEKVAGLIIPSFTGQDVSFRRIIVYRGETKLNWPKEGSDYINWQEMLVGKTAS